MVLLAPSRAQAGHRTAREMLWSEPGCFCLCLPREKEVPGAPRRRRELGAGVQMGLLGHFLVSRRVTSEEKGHSVLFN